METPTAFLPPDQANLVRSAAVYLLGLRRPPGRDLLEIATLAAAATWWRRLEEDADAGALEIRPGESEALLATLRAFLAPFGPGPRVGQVAPIIFPLARRLRRQIARHQQLETPIAAENEGDTPSSTPGSGSKSSSHPSPTAGTPAEKEK